MNKKFNDKFAKIDRYATYTEINKIIMFVQIKNCFHYFAIIYMITSKFIFFTVTFYLSFKNFVYKKVNVIGY